MVKRNRFDNREDRDAWDFAERTRGEGVEDELASGDLGGPYARDDYRGGFGGDYARETRWGGTGAGGDYFASDAGGRGLPYVGYGPTQSRRTLGGNERGLGGSAAAYGRTDYPQSFRGRGPKNYRRSDERITEDINQILTDAHDVDASDIEVRVENGEVMLSGTVDSRRTKRRAEDLAEQVSGVIDVHNRLVIAGNDREATIGKASE